MRTRATLKRAGPRASLAFSMHVGSFAARRQSAPPPAPGTGTHRVLPKDEPPPLVLLVDDVEDTREVYAQYFDAMGLRVEHAVDGEHALFKIAALMPSIVVMDLAMPTLDGWEATQKVKSHPRTKDIPIIALTGHATPPALERARHAGADAVLTKPCAPAALLDVIRSLLDRDR